MSEPKEIDSSSILDKALQEPLSGESLGLASLYLNNVTFLTTMLSMMKTSGSIETANTRQNMKHKRRSNIRALKALVLKLDEATKDD